MTPTLTPAEARVLKKAQEPLSVREIAAALALQPGSVQMFLNQVYRKLKVHGRVEACDYAAKHPEVYPAPVRALGPTPDDAKLTYQESRVLSRIGEGLTYHAAASDLGLSVNGVKFHVTNVCRKLRVSGSREAYRIALQRRLLVTAPPPRLTRAEIQAQLSCVTVLEVDAPPPATVTRIPQSRKERRAAEYLMPGELYQVETAFEQTIEDFLIEAGKTQRFAVNTITRYRTYLRRLGRFARATCGDLDHFTPAIARGCFEQLKREGLRPRTMIGYINALEAFVTWCLETERWPPTVPIPKIKRPKLDKPHRPIVTDAEVLALLQACERHPDSRRGLLAKAVISILAFSALRRMEALDLYPEDIDFAKGTIRVRSGKGGKPGIVSVPPECLQPVQAYLDTREECRHPFLFSADVNRRLGEHGLILLLDRVKRIAGLGDATHIRPHAFRRGVATRMVRAGSDILTVKAHLRHSLVATTYLYCVSAQDDHKNAPQFTLLQESSIEPKPALASAPKTGSVSLWLP